MDNTAKKFRAYEAAEDSMMLWFDKYMEEEIIGQHSDVKKVRRQLLRFIQFFEERYGHDKVTALVKRDVVAWLDQLYLPEDEGGSGYAASTVNNHQSTLSGYITWLRGKVPYLINHDPMKGIREIMLPDPEPRTLTPQQILSLKNICDRLERFHLKEDRNRVEERSKLKSYARPKRDRAMVYVFLSTGLRREELVNIDIDQVVPNDPDLLPAARGARIVKVRGKGKTEGTVYLSADARNALADYLKHERPQDETRETKALFLSVITQPKRKPDGRIHPRRINGILEEIGKWHDAEQKDESRKISPLRPHDLRHTFLNELAKKPDVSQEDLVRAARHRNPRYLPLYTKPPAERSASFIEDL
ncbi:tyrosine-type recombinase/integrase [Paenibacillus terreus]|uniref:tyrosine-type recombinase/integrase n=1 Tax=Paenibacillus terreus TaxID=1387834 RepID=UPI0035CCC8A1